MKAILFAHAFLAVLLVFKVISMISYIMLSFSKMNCNVENACINSYCKYVLNSSHISKLNLKYPWKNEKGHYNLTLTLTLAKMKAVNCHSLFAGLANT